MAELTLKRLSDFQPRELNWLWYPYISWGNTSMIFGPGGHGKSYISAALAKAVANGEPLPGQTVALAPGKVLMLSAEDDPEVVIRPRLEEMKANLDNIYLPSEPFELSASGIKTLRRFIKESGASLITIDPVVHYLGGKIDMNKMNEVRSVIGKLQHLAMETNTAMILYHHSRKAGQKDESQEFERASGSADFVNAMRSVLMVQRANNGEEYLLKHVKSNYGPLGNSIGFKFGEDPIFSWGEFFTKSGATAYLSTRVRPQREAARAFIISLLQNGPVLSAEVIERGKDEGFSRTTLYRAYEGLGKVRYVKTATGIVTFWELDPLLVKAIAGDNVEVVDPKAAVKEAMARLNAKLEK